VTIGTG
jgi:Delta3-Delta2-enoyl-CoA isomerase